MDNIREMPREFEVYSKFRTVYPLDRSDRQSDLEKMLAVDGSFIIESIRRNGTSSLMLDFAAQREGIYIDCMNVFGHKSISYLDKQIQENPDRKVLLLDEIASLYNLFDDDNVCFGYLMRLSKERQLILRFHTETRATTERMVRLINNGFGIITIGKIPYDEFKAIFDREFAWIGFKMSERFIQYAHTEFHQLFKQVRYIAEAFRLMVENPGQQFTEQEVEERTKYPVPGGTYRYSSTRV